MNRETQQPNAWTNPFLVRDRAAAPLAAALELGAGLKQKIRTGWALGTFVIEMPVPATVEAMALAGFDFVVLDLEHSALDLSRVPELIAAGHRAGIPVLVRPWTHDAGLLGKILDMGANGLMVPRIETPAQAREIVAQTRFAPEGVRGFSPLTRYDALERPLEALNASTVLVLQIEGSGAVAQAREIASVPGADALFIGPYDLALSMGVAPGSPQVYEAAAALAEALPRSCTLGIYVDDPARCGEWAARRFPLQCAGYDGRMLAGSARSLVESARRAMKGNPGGG